MPVDDGSEDAFHCFLVERLDADDVEVSQEARCDHVPTATRRSHGAQHHYVRQLQNARVLPNNRRHNLESI